MPYSTDSRGFERLVENHPDAVRILAEGDSWFAYPRRYIAFGEAANIVQILAERDYYVIYSTASIGDEAVSMLTGEQKFGFVKRISAHPFDLILFSGGGNDIVGKYDFDFFLKHRTGAAHWRDCIDLYRLDNKLAQIESVYIELMERVLHHSLNRDIRVVTHVYDYCIPSPEGYELFDIIPIGESWIYPYLHMKGFTDLDEQRQVIVFMLERFAERLDRVRSRYPDRLHVAPTQGTLGESNWRNEIHPTPAGFRKVSRVVHRTMQQALAGN